MKARDPSIDEWCYFVAFMLAMCNHMLNTFLEICEKIGVPIATDKTVWATPQVIFLGMLLDGFSMTIAIPMEKKDRAVYLLTNMLNKRKAMVKELQSLCGFLNFLNKAIFPGRTFTRRMYSKFSGLIDIRMIEGNQKWKQQRRIALQQHHHIRLDQEFKLDCRLWLEFLTNSTLKSVVSRTMVDLVHPAAEQRTTEIVFTSDASASPVLGYGCMFNEHWMYGQWDETFIRQEEPSIEYLELYALYGGILTWENEIKDCWFTVHCDNVAMVHMINSLSSKCKNCMVLLRMLVLNGLKFNRKLSALYISTRDNYLSDSLSRLNLKKFFKLAPEDIDRRPAALTEAMTPMAKLWIE